MTDDEFRKIMHSAGVPRYAIDTTLPGLNEQRLRDYIKFRKFKDTVGNRGSVIYPATPNAADRARRVFFVMAKEMVLANVSLVCITLSELAQHLLDYDDEDQAISNAEMLFITDFYERGAPYPLDAKAAGWVRSWLKRKMENGVGVNLLSDDMDMSQWWSPSFLTVMLNYVTPFAVAAK